jgi:hypothetical protein
MSKEKPDRYFIQRDSQSSWSIADRDVVAVERDHKVSSGLKEAHALELLRKLNLHAALTS